MSRVLVMGPGRSGSRYLRDLLGKLKFEVIHEIGRKFRGPDQSFLEDCDWKGAGDWLAETDNLALVGFPYGFMVHYLRHRVPSLPVIAVHRKKEEWIQKVGSGSNPVKKATSWPRGLESSEQYYELYECLMNSVAPPILHLRMSDLDDCIQSVNEFLS